MNTKVLIFAATLLFPILNLTGYFQPGNEVQIKEVFKTEISQTSLNKSESATTGVLQSSTEVKKPVCTKNYNIRKIAFRHSVLSHSRDIQFKRHS